MKITPKQYATLLYELTRGVAKKDIQEKIRDFLNLLLKNRAFGQLSKILLFYKQYYNKQENVLDVEVVTGREVEKKIKTEINNIMDGVQPKDWPSARLDSNKVRTEVRYSIDSTVLGGARIKIGDYMIDDTLKARVVALRNKL